MLTHYRKENRKIAMGLLSFHKKLNAESSLLKEIDTYESAEDYELFSIHLKILQISKESLVFIGMIKIR